MKGRLEEINEFQASDPVCSQLIKYCKFGWPDKHHIEGLLKVYWSGRGYLTVHKGLLMYGDQIVVPKALQKDTLLRMHQGHLGIQRCKLRAQSAVWWPGIMTQVEEQVKWCQVGRRLRTIVPVTDTQLVPKWDYLPSFSKSERAFKSKQASNYDSQHRTCLQSTWKTCGSQQEKRRSRDKLEAKPIPQGHTMWTSHLVR